MADVESKMSSSSKNASQHRGKDRSLSSTDDVEENISGAWSQAEERAAVRQLDLRVLPIVLFGFFSLQIDRGNISSALTTTMLEDLDITKKVVNNGQTILYMCSLAGEIPCNLILQRVGAKWWIPFQMTLWGFVATMQVLMTNKTGFYVCRAFLGLAESGFIPGGVYYLSTLYTRRQLATRCAVFWGSSYIGKACSSLLASAIFTISSTSRYKPWQWLFLIEGVVTTFIGIVALVFLPRSLNDPRTLVPGLSILNKHDSWLLNTRLIVDDPSKKDSQKLKIKLRDVWDALTAWRIVPLLEVTAYGRNIHGIVWLTLNGRTPTRRSVYSAVYLVFTNIAQAVGNQLFQAHDAPKYYHGLAAVIGLQSVAILASAVALFIFWYSNRHGLGETALPDMRAEIDPGKGTEGPGTVVQKPFQYAI